MGKIMWEVNFGVGHRWNVIAKDVKDAIDKALKKFKWNSGEKGELSDITEVKAIGEED